MRFDTIALFSTLLGGVAASVINAPIDPRDIDIEARDFNELYKRRGGGGGGGRGGGGGSSGGSKSGSGGSKSGSGSSGSGSSSGSKNTGSKSTGGGRTSGGTGPQPSYLGGKYYGGGASTPYSSGGRSPSGISPVFLGAGALAFWPGIWLYGAHTYPYGHHRNGDDDGYWYEYHNVTTDDDERREVICACSNYSECSCDKSDEADDYLDELVGNGSYAALNKTLINVAKVNGTMTLLINGTLPNGTTAAESAAGESMQTMAQAMGFWPAIAAVGAAVFLS